MVDSGIQEPLGFQLLAGASELSASNLRGASIVAIVALEVGFKSFVAELVPDAEWLAMNAPTPPIERMLREYLPKLPVTHPLPAGDARPPPEATLIAIKAAVTRRNAVTHAGTETTADSVDETIQAVSDVLRLLDYYRGHEWASTYMTYPSAVALGLRDRDEQLERFLSES
jgi:hypothetical protein